MGQAKNQQLEDQFVKDLIYEVEHQENPQGKESDKQDGSLYCKD
jgi:hypothetical protein